MDTNGWKFYLKKSGSWNASKMAFAVSHPKIGDDYFYINGERYNGCWAKGYLNILGLVEVGFSKAMSLLSNDEVRQKVCKILKINPIQIQGPPNPFLINTYRNLLKQKRAFCADSALQLNIEDNLTMDYLITSKQIFRCKKELDKYYLPESEEND